MIPKVKSLRAVAVLAMLWASPAIVSQAQAGTVAPRPETLGDAVHVRFEPARQQTRVGLRVAPDLCLSFSLPQEWRAGTDGPKLTLESTSSSAELEMSLRSARELGPASLFDLAGRDAARLQQDYEDLLGRPAQSVSLASLAAGAARWSATWIDAQLPSSAMTVETFIVPLSNEWVLEFSLADVEARPAYDALMRGVLEQLTVRREPGCGI